MHFVKAQTNGNDFVIINEDISKDKLKFISDRHLGIGCDQIIIANKIKDNKYNIEFFNKDSSKAFMCGNGACAVSKYINKILKNNSSELELIVEKVSYKSIISGDNVTLLFPKPIKISENIISTGNKHFICDISLIDKAQLIQKNNPDCNIHFIKKFSENSIKIRTFERGVGWTKSCGSGAVAVGFYSEIPEEIEIIHDGGSSKVEIIGNFAYLTTIPKLVFEGTMYE